MDRCSLYQLSRGSGKRLLLGILLMIAPICAFLPNATTVILLAPVVIRIAEYFDTDFAPLLFLLVFVANTSGLLTLVGDPSSFVVGTAINMSFVEFLRIVTPGAVLAILALVALVPWLFRPLWKSHKSERQLELPQIRAPFLVLAGAVILVIEVVFFLLGERLTVPLYPAAVSLLGSVLALAIVHQSGLDSVSAILQDVDWPTLVFFCCVFVLVGAMADNGVLAYAALLMPHLFGRDLALASLSMLFGLGVISAVVPNIPLVVAMTPLVKGLRRKHRAGHPGDDECRLHWPISSGHDSPVPRDDVRRNLGRKCDHGRSFSQSDCRRRVSGAWTPHKVRRIREIWDQGHNRPAGCLGSIYLLPIPASRNSSLIPLWPTIIAFRQERRLRWIKYACELFFLIVPNRTLRCKDPIQASSQNHAAKPGMYLRGRTRDTIRTPVNLSQMPGGDRLSLV
jgi:hypothetical protein